MLDPNPKAPAAIHPIPMTAEGVGYFFKIIIDHEYIFTPSKTPAKCAQQQGRLMMCSIIRMHHIITKFTMKLPRYNNENCNEILQA